MLVNNIRLILFSIVFDKRIKNEQINYSSFR